MYNFRWNPLKYRMKYLNKLVMKCCEKNKSY